MQTTALRDEKNERVYPPGFYRLVEDILEIPQMDWDSTYFLCYDIDGLRKINFSFSRETGDALLDEIGDWAISVSGGQLYRIDGDMFCLLMRGRSFEQVFHFAQSALYRSQASWALPNNGDQVEIFVTASIAVIPMDEYVMAQTLPDLFDRCLDASKKSKGIAVFNRKADEAAQEEYRFQMDLKTCILKGMDGFHLVYQPIVDPVTGLWKGLEALCRWERPGCGMVPPDRFIREVETLGLICQLGEWVLQTAIAACVELKLYEYDDFFISVNVSALQISQPGFGKMLISMLAQRAFPAHKLNLEITESNKVYFDDETCDTISELRKLGITFALDDFGTGYSSFNLLKNLPAQYIKIEREFIYDIEKNNYLQFSMYMIAETAHLNGMRMICEGIETPEQLQCAMRTGTDLIQGYYYSKPLAYGALRRKVNRFHSPEEGKETVQKSPPLFTFSQWLASKDNYNINPTFFSLHHRCMDILMNGEDLELAVNKIIEAIGMFFRVNRVFVFLQDEGTVFSNRYEWCADCAEEQIHLFQQVDVAEDGFIRVLRDQHVIISMSEHQLPARLVEILKENNQGSSIQSSVILPMERRGEVLGFVGFDDVNYREWLPDEILILQNLCLLVLMKQNQWNGEQPR